ncbi:DJ-1 family glyoxalase III [Synechococcus sp. PCC 7336]|uniref:DJ-1 family glyoxalase III n=1 Tax=Synechococcus sp. PCC 7336 TaxID=195250 RepID=UPI000A064B21|nr:DJ-1 family glyoxalase III [Synechococcus sp. PCC 7336]
MVRVLVPLPDGFEEIEAISIIDILRRAEIDVVVAGLSQPGAAVTGSHQIPVLPDTTLDETWSETLASSFDALVIPGGPGVKALLDNPKIGQLARQFSQARKCTAAICAAPLVLSQAGLLHDRTATSFPSTQDQMEVADYSQERVVVDGHIVTSRGAGTAVEFALQVVAELRGPTKAAEVSAAIVSTWLPQAIATPQSTRSSTCGANAG